MYWSTVIYDPRNISQMMQYIHAVMYGLVHVCIYAYVCIYTVYDLKIVNYDMWIDELYNMG